MKKLFFVVVLLLLVLFVSWWAKGANFSLMTMMRDAEKIPAASPSAQIKSNTTPTPVPANIFITLTPSGFSPNVILVHVGSKITWTNKSGVVANISSDPEDAFSQFNIGDFAQNISVSLIMSKTGRYHYYNNKMPLEVGTIIVQ